MNRKMIYSDIENKYSDYLMSIPVEEFTTGTYCDDDNRKCAIGHLMFKFTELPKRYNEIDNLDYSIIQNALAISESQFMNIMMINDQSAQANRKELLRNYMVSVGL